MNLISRPTIDPDQLVIMLDRIERRFEVRLRGSAVEERLDRAEQKRMIALARLGDDADAKEQHELRRLVDKVAPGLLERLAAAKEEQARRVQERQDEAQGEPRRVLLPEGAAALPAAALHDVLEGELEPLDLAPLALLALSFTTGRLSDYAAGAGNAWFAEDGTLVVRGRGDRLVEDLDVGATSPEDRVLSIRLPAILDRLARREFLDVARQSGEVHIRPGRRLAELDPERGGK